MTIIDDRIAENPEQHFIGVLNFVRDNPPGASLGSNTAVLTILDNNDCKLMSQVLYFKEHVKQFIDSTVCH